MLASVVLSSGAATAHPFRVRVGKGSQSIHRAASVSQLRPGNDVLFGGKHVTSQSLASLSVSGRNPETLGGLRGLDGVRLHNERRQSRGAAVCVPGHSRWLGELSTGAQGRRGAVGSLDSLPGLGCDTT